VGGWGVALVGGRPPPRRSGSTPIGSLAAFHLREALVGEGRRLLRLGRPEAALSHLDEALAEGAEFADVQFLHGFAVGLGGDWAASLRDAQAALRRNPDYVEARVLEACCLAHLDRGPEAAASLNKLLESGRRVRSVLIEELQRPEGYAAASVPTDLTERLRSALAEDPDQTLLAQAVALCRGDRLADGIVKLQRLRERRPDYADYRLKLAAALYQDGRLEEARAEVEKALELNPRYRAAACLKALILADLRRFESALQELGREPAPVPGAGTITQEDLLAGYLESVLQLLTGRLDEAHDKLARWGELTRVFPRSQLLQAAIADLRGQPEETRLSLRELVEHWPNDAEYIYCWIGCLLKLGDWIGAQQALARYPRGSEVADERPLLLANQLALAQGRTLNTISTAQKAASPAWRLLAARALARQGEWPECRAEIERLWTEGYRTEPVARLLIRCAARADAESDPPANGPWPEVVPDSAVPDLIFGLHRRERVVEAEALLHQHRTLHPEDLRWTWLSAAFWLDPIRRWIS
jgi:tetratricopeptide (TPR) repeat protein